MPGYLDPLTADRGYLAFESPVAPAAGANYSYAVTNVDWLRVLTVKATLATDANVADRLFSVDYIAPRSGTVVRNAAPLLITASTGATVFQWDHAHAVSEWNTGTPVFAPLVPLPLVPSWVVRLTVDNIQATDAITAISLVVEKFWAPRHDDDASRERLYSAA